MAQAGAAAFDPTQTEDEERAPRYVVEAIEHGDIKLPPALIFGGGKLDVYPEVLSQGLFRVKLERDTIALQAGGLIGFIPLNDRLAIEVRTRVPVANLERVLIVSGRDTPLALPFIRSFAHVDDEAAPFLDVIASHFCALLSDLRLEGLFKTYVRARRRSSSPSGRLLPLPSAIAIATTGRPEAIFERFERTVDNDPNRCIRFAHNVLLGIYRSRARRPGGLKLLAQLRSGVPLLDEVRLDETGRFLGDPLVQEPARIASNRPVMREAVELASFIARGSSVSVRSRAGRVLLPSILLRMDDIFEAFVRSILALYFKGEPGLGVLDGNLKPPAGAAANVFGFVPPGEKNVGATPDTVLTRENQPVCIIETKYKPCDGRPARDDLNQAITYGVAYDCRTVVLVYPAIDEQPTSLAMIGSAGNIRLFRGTIALGAGDLPQEEKSFCRLLAELLQQS